MNQAALERDPDVRPLSRDLLFDDADFHRIQSMIYERAGIVLAGHKRDMVYSRIARRVRHHRMQRFGDYLNRLQAHPEAAEWQAFTNALTTNLTAFFREEHHFPLLADHVRGRQGPVRVWSAGASTGQEAYSIAMTLVETLGPQADARVWGTDIDTEALEVARKGVYPRKQVELMDAGRCRRFLQRGTGSLSDHVRVHPSLVSRVKFDYLNLNDPSGSVPALFDAIFCRNVMIYFDAATHTRLLARFARYLKPDGLLFVGHSENFSRVSDHFRLRGRTVYTLKGE